MPKGRAIFIQSIRRTHRPGAPSRAHPSVWWSTAVALVVSLLATLPASTTVASQTVSMPFPGGQAVRIIQGYNGGTHQGRSQYGLDLVLAKGETSGAEVLSPIDGTVTWAQAPNAGNGCIAIAFKDGSYSVTLCHVILRRAYSRGESIERGDSLGTVGAAGEVGNNGAPHVHLELHRGGQASSPVPFSPPEGLPIDGVALAASGTFNEHGTRATIASSNRGGSGAVLVASSSLPQPITARAAQQRVPAAPPQAARPRPAPPNAAQAAGSARTAVVQGTGACLKVRKEPSADAPVVDCLPDGTQLALMPTGSHPQWRQIEGKGWWVAADYLRRTHAVVKGADTCLNVRELPSTGAPILGCIPEGSPVTIAEGPKTADDRTWYRIEKAQSLPKGGWVVSQYLD